MDIEEYIISKKKVVEAIFCEKDDEWFADDYYKAIHFCLLVFSQDSPLHETTPLLAQRMDFAAHNIGIDADSDMVNHAVEMFLSRIQHSYEYEYLVTCQMVLMYNNRELRQNRISLLDDPEKRLKVAPIQSILLDNNQKIIAEIHKYTKQIFGENNKLIEKQSKSLRAEDMMKQQIRS